MRDVNVPDGWKPLAIKGFMERVGPLLRPMHSDERNLYGLMTNESHVNPIGLVHGGVLTSLMDQVLALVAWNAVDRRPVVTVSMDSCFLNSARAGDFLEARASVRHSTRSLIFLSAEVSASSRQVASASAIMKISNGAEQTA